MFEHRLVSGPADKSYGVHVAKMAGMPSAVMTTQNLLAQLETHSSGDVGALNAAQLSLFISLMNDGNCLSFRSNGGCPVAIEY